MDRLAAGLVITPLPAPIMTPPARDALRISSILNLSLKREDIIKVPKQLPVSDNMVFPMMRLLSNGLVGKKPALNEGQNIQRNSVPIIAMVELM